jgi:hypothetical protein
MFLPDAVVSLKDETSRVGRGQLQVECALVHGNSKR